MEKDTNIVVEKFEFATLDVYIDDVLIGKVTNPVEEAMFRLKVVKENIKNAKYGYLDLDSIEFEGDEAEYDYYEIDSKTGLLSDWKDGLYSETIEFIMKKRDILIERGEETF